MNSDTANPWLVIKFGGTSVSNLTCWKNIINIANDHLSKGLRPLIVCSAPHRVSNYLENISTEAINNDYQASLTEIKQIYTNLAQQLQLTDTAQLNASLTELQQLVYGISLLKDASTSVHWLSENLQINMKLLQERGVGVLPN